MSTIFQVRYVSSMKFIIVIDHNKIIKMKNFLWKKVENCVVIGLKLEIEITTLWFSINLKMISQKIAIKFDKLQDFQSWYDIWYNIVFSYQKHNSKYWNKLLYECLWVITYIKEKFWNSLIKLSFYSFLKIKLLHLLHSE